MKSVAAFLLASLGTAAVAATPPEDPPAEWVVRPQGQLPVLAANHAVGGFGLAVGVEKALFAFQAEGQIYPIEVCDNPCGTAYAAGVGVALQPRLLQTVATRFGVMLQYFSQSDLHQSFTAIGPRVGARWPEVGTAVSLDVGVAIAGSSNFGPDGFARNKLLGWGMPQVILGIWF
jgi:hypothetical protein